jgi:hypothetical protein
MMFWPRVKDSYLEEVDESSHSNNTKSLVNETLAKQKTDEEMIKDEQSGNRQAHILFRLACNKGSLAFCLPLFATFQ